jgi:hypothetical protein
MSDRTRRTVIRFWNAFGWLLIVVPLIVVWMVLT